MHRFILLLPLLLVFPFIVFAQQIDTAMVKTNGTVNTITRSGNTLYVGGNFSYIGKHTGLNGPAVININDGDLITSLPNLDRTISTMVDDGKGGWFMAGEFTTITGTYGNSIIHLLPDFTIDPSFKTTVSAQVNCLVRKGDTLFIGGWFETVNDRPRLTLAAVDTKEGKVLPWNPNINFISSVTVFSLFVDNNTLYVGGRLSHLGNNATEHLGAYDLSTGKPTNLSVKIDVDGYDPSGYVNKVIVHKGILYFTGAFNRVNGSFRNRFAAIDLKTLELLSWNPNPITPEGYSGYNFDIDAYENEIFIAGGYFSNIGGQNRNGFASVDMITGRATSWNPNLTVDKLRPSVVPFKIYKDKLYLFGDFNSVSGIPRHNFAQVDLINRTVTNIALNPSASWIREFSFSGNKMFLLGDVNAINGKFRNNLASIDVATGQVTNWNPNPNDVVQTVVTSGNLVYVGGKFTTIGSANRNKIAAFDAYSGIVTSWKPNIYSDSDGMIDAIAISKNTVFVGGNFYTMGEQYRSRLAAFDITSGNTTAWNPKVYQLGSINCLKIRNGLLYVGGNFSIREGKNRSYLAALDINTGVPTDWNPNPNREVLAFDFTDNQIIIGGNFSSIGSQQRNKLASVDLVSGLPTTWNPNVNNTISTLAILGENVYIGGSFSTVSGVSRNRLAAVNIYTGISTTWAPNPDRKINTIVAFNEKTLYVGGEFVTIDANNISNLAAFGARTLVFNNYIKGNIYREINQNCVKEAGENNLENIIVSAEPGSYYGITDKEGNYKIAVDTGSYVIKQILPADKGQLAKQICPLNDTTYRVNFETYNNEVNNLDFANQITLCPQLTIKVASGRRRRCFRGYTTIDYCNEGLASAKDVKVYLKLPEYVLPIHINKTYTIDADSTYIFNIGTLSPNQCGSITIIDSVMCGNENIRGLTQCTKAWITPTNGCITHDPKWDQSDITLKAKCKASGIVSLGMFNSGKGNMADSTSYRIYLDAQLTFTNKIKLAQGDSLRLEVVANGQTVRLEIDQRPYHPNRKKSDISLEACGINKEGKFSTGFVPQFSSSNQLLEEATECLPIIDSFDPNDKSVFPIGTTANHYTPSRTPLEYTIRFQNTGTDTAYKVIVVDTLSENFDVATLKLGTISHPYKLSVSGKGQLILTFTFTNINLPDSNKNEPASHGYIKFSITPKSSVTQGTVIENNASIIFDYNKAITTNIISNTIHDLSPTIPPSNSGRVIICGVLNPAAFAGSNRNFCKQDTVKLRANPSIVGQGKWRVLKGGGLIQELNNSSTLVTNLSYGENIFEWKLPTSTCGTDSTTSRVTVTRFATPLIKEVKSERVCGEGRVSLHVKGAAHYNWYTNVSSTEPISTDSIFITPVLTVSTTYYVAAIESGCEGPRIPVEALIIPIPKSPTIIQKTADSLYCPIEATSYEWFMDGVALNTHDQSISADKSGKYTVKITVNNCTSALSEVFNYEKIPTGINEEIDLKIKVYPNPSSGIVTLWMELTNETSVELSIFDSFGREILKEKHGAKNYVIEKKIDLSSFGKGLFVVRIQTKQGLLIKRIIIQ
ncbi:T9SS type A sorting domain-containing protein [Rhodocytophaga rosea]|uniref:T9SS type A sorting domain-containing protein n=1 Tax=Rhodocytophaga rosea TaxID=2704465 RepID=A0A6C0GRV7_9BACT|nr:T9SS type A sorting domain-containing protein [Rhodocytophaga rosea]QHT70796.1 T9SS type A sorting domain-containing protein [Rhodocytophaga rosea]